MELVSESKKRVEFERYPYIHVPVNARDVDITETEEVVFVSYTLPERGEICIPMGNC